MMFGSVAYERKRLRLIGRLAIGPKVLDIGYTQMPNPWLRRFETVGLDVQAPAEPSGYAEEIRGDAMDLSTLLPGRQFNTVVAGELLEHLENPCEFLRGVRPLVAPGGRLVLSTPNPLGFPVLFCELFRIKRFFYSRDHLCLFPPRWVERLLERAGFEVEAIRGVGLQLVVAAPPCPKCMSYQLIYVARPAGDR